MEIFKNKISLEYRAIESDGGKPVCAYWVVHSIEKTFRYDGTHESWSRRKDSINGRAGSTACIKCFPRQDKEGELHIFPEPWREEVTHMTITPTSDLLQMYVKWAYKLKDGKFTEYDGKKYGPVDSADLENLRQIYVSLTKEEKTSKLPVFIECKCGKCKNEWIVF